jgi:hypothetical protein
MRSIKTLCLLLIIFCFAGKALAQVAILQKDVLSKIQNGNTHIVVKSMDFPDAQLYLDVFKKYWTVTKGVDFITSDKLVGNMVEGDSYFKLEAIKETGYSGSNAIFVYLNLWQPSKKMLSDKKLKIGHEEALAHIQLSVNSDLARAVGVNVVSVSFSNKDLDYNLDGNGQFYHWNPGLIKNYLQLLCATLKAGKKLDFHDDITDKAQIKNLATSTLYCPEDNINKMGTFVRAGKTVDVKDVFEDYKYNYKLLSDKELSEKILADGEVFYYILFVRNSTNKLIAVVNSATGEIIYSRYTVSMTISNLKSGDLKDLYKAINKN